MILSSIPLLSDSLVSQLIRGAPQQNIFLHFGSFNLQILKRFAQGGPSLISNGLMMLWAPKNYCRWIILKVFQSLLYYISSHKYIYFESLVQISVIFRHLFSYFPCWNSSLSWLCGQPRTLCFALPKIYEFFCWGGFKLDVIRYQLFPT